MIFISYSRRNLPVAREVVAKIKRQLDLDCWIDLTGIESASQFQDVIINAIDKSDIILFLMSKDSMQSEFSKKEVMYAKKTGKRVVPLCIDDVPMKGWFLFEFGDVDCIDYHNPDQWEKLLLNLSSWTGKDLTPTEQTSVVSPNVTRFTKWTLIACVTVFVLLAMGALWFGWVKSSDSLAHVFHTMRWRTPAKIVPMFQLMIPAFLLGAASLVVVLWRKVWWPTMLVFATIPYVIGDVILHPDAFKYMKMTVSDTTMALTLLYLLLIFIILVAVFAPANYKAFEAKRKKFW